MIEFVVASHDDAILKKNIIASDCYRKSVFTIRKGFDNVPRAYNSASPRKGRIIVYVHHDVFLPPSFMNDLKKSIDQVPSGWGVLGVAGVKLIDGKKQIRGHIMDRDREWGIRSSIPQEVDTLDELLLITNGDITFDEQFDLHFYGADICMQARLQGRKCYSINAFCHHNSGLPLGHRTDSFRECEKKFREKYIHHLPIVTTCSHLLP